MMARPATPPTTPPAIGPACEEVENNPLFDEEEEEEGVEEEEGDRFALFEAVVLLKNPSTAGSWNFMLPLL